MISRYLPQTEFCTPEGCHIVEIHNVADDEGCSIARARVRAGVTTQLHALSGVMERYVILEGEGLVETGNDAPTSVSTLDVVVIEAGAPQRITNVGKTDLVFLCVCTPRFQQECYINLEATGESA